MTKEFTYHLKTVLSWGKHKGKTIKEVIDMDPGWIKYHHKRNASEVDYHFKLSQDAFQYLLERLGNRAGYKKVRHRGRW